MTGTPEPDRRILMKHLRDIALKCRQAGVTCEQALLLGKESQSVMSINQMLGITRTEFEKMFREAWEEL